MPYNTIKFHKYLHTNEGLYDIFGTEVVKGWLGNGFCDDQLNKAECNFDGGDCCGSDVNTDFCENCECNLGKLIID